MGLTACLVPPRVGAHVKGGLLELVDHAAEHGGWSIRRSAAALGLDHARVLRSNPHLAHRWTSGRFVLRSTVRTCAAVRDRESYASSPDIGIYVVLPSRIPVDSPRLVSTRRSPVEGSSEAVARANEIAQVPFTSIHEALDVSAPDAPIDGCRL